MEANSKYLALSYQFMTSLYEENFKNINALPKPKNMGELSVLGILSMNNGSMTSGDLTKRLNLTTPRTAALLKVLEKKGLINRTHPKDDKRITIATLTDEGKTEVKDGITKVVEDIAALYQRLGEEEMNHFLATLKKISEIRKELNLCSD